MKKLAILSVALIMFGAFTPGEGYKVGDMATDFKLKNINDKMVALADYRDAKGFIVVFTCNHCPFAVKYQERLVALDKKYAKAGYPVIAINSNDATQYPDDDFAAMKERAKEKGFTFPYLLDESQEIAKAYGATRTPHVYILKKEAEGLVVKYIGAIDDNADDAKAVKIRYVEDAVAALQAGKSVTPEFTKAVGCGIKWKKKG
jgi:peroxiredoxin